jgi:hypothetical protein
VQSSYVVEVNNEHVILGNSAMLKCTIPSFVTDFVYVASWTISDERGELANLDTQSTGIFLRFRPKAPLICFILFPPPTLKRLNKIIAPLYSFSIKLTHFPLSLPKSHAFLG